MSFSLSQLPTVEVLLATYNGERFLRDQIDSILAQDYSQVRILACDDGSTDETVAILAEYRSRYQDRFQIMTSMTATGDPRWNFLRLLKQSTAEYVCFSDQDDVWNPQKISLSMETMLRLESRCGKERPALVFTDLCVVNERLEIMERSHWRHNHTGPTRATNLALLLGQNIVTGCTSLLNRTLVELAWRMPAEAEMHDHWVALLAATFGESQGIQKGTVLYRQHANNVLGSGGRRTEWTKCIEAWQERRKRSEGQASGLLRVHGPEMPPEKRRIVEAYIYAGQNRRRTGRIAAILRYGFYVLGIRNNLAMLWYLWTSRTMER